jgi:hypothetical protein
MRNFVQLAWLPSKPAALPKCATERFERREQAGKITEWFVNSGSAEIDHTSDLIAYKKNVLGPQVPNDKVAYNWLLSETTQRNVNLRTDAS